MNIFPSFFASVLVHSCLNKTSVIITGTADCAQ